MRNVKMAIGVVMALCQVSLVANSGRLRSQNRISATATSKAEALPNQRATPWTKCSKDVETWWCVR